MTFSPRSAPMISDNSSRAPCTDAARPMMLSARKFAFFNQTNLLPPMNGRVCNASIVDLMRVAACSALSAQPSMTSNPKSPNPGGVNFSASSAATRFTSASSEPTTAWIFGATRGDLILGEATAVT